MGVEKMRKRREAFIDRKEDKINRTWMKNRQIGKADEVDRWMCWRREEREETDRGLWRK
jgi:hypothetical protein